jgi:acyl-coenzyme A thioesterase PaaI-like protein
MPVGADVLSVEFKVNLLRPAVGEMFVAEARVIKAGRTLTVTRCDVYGWVAEEAKLIATMLATMIRR